MSDRQEDYFDVTPEILLKAYACGIFPMSESADDPDLFWVEPKQRGILPLDQFHLPRSLKKTLRNTKYHVRIDQNFSATIRSCAEATDNRRSTWINSKILNLYNELHALGHAHSFEVYDEEELIGGLYGVRLGLAFFGESMFSRRTDASKIALAHLVYQMRCNHFSLLDTQFTTDHLARFGVVEIPKTSYQNLLEQALQGEAFFDKDYDGGAMSDSILQSFSQIS